MSVTNNSMYVSVYIYIYMSMYCIHTYVGSDLSDAEKTVNDLPLHQGISGDVEGVLYEAVTHLPQTENPPCLDIASRRNGRTSTFGRSSSKLKSDDEGIFKDTTSAIQQSLESPLSSRKQEHSIVL